jgi:1-acyl-sn-glycerol-3-phosphate acyltransferase
MGDTFYRTVRLVGSTAFLVSSRAVVIGLENVPRSGPMILASTHLSPYDVPLLIRHTHRLLDFVSITELFEKPLVGRFFGALNAFPLDRSRPDAPTVRILLRRLAAGRAVAMFPEGAIQNTATSVLRTGKLRPGIGRLASLAAVPVTPCVVINSGAFASPSAWLPLRRTEYGVAYGPPTQPTADACDLERTLVSEFIRLQQQLQTKLRAESPSAKDRRQQPAEH